VKAAAFNQYLKSPLGIAFRRKGMMYTKSQRNSRCVLMGGVWYDYDRTIWKNVTVR